jgi:hypothetical protein
MNDLSPHTATGLHNSRLMHHRIRRQRPGRGFVHWWKGLARCSCRLRPQGQRPLLLLFPGFDEKQRERSGGIDRHPGNAGVNATKTPFPAVCIAAMGAQRADSFRHAGQAAQHLPHVRLDFSRQIRAAGGKTKRSLHGAHQAINVLLGRQFQSQLYQN